MINMYGTICISVTGKFPIIQIFTLLKKNDRMFSNLGIGQTW